MTKNTLFKLSLLCVIFTCVVVVLGAFTRLVDAGLGCPDWPGCYGHLLWPSSADEVARAEAIFPEAPVEHDKTWPEMVHRYFASLLGLFIIGLCVLMVRYKKRMSDPSAPVKLTFALLLLVILQGAFGAWTVTLKLWPQVVTAHLLGGFTTLSLLWLLVQRLSSWHWRVAHETHGRLQSLKPWVWFVFVLVVLQITLGGWTSTNYAALACVDFPKCHAKWWPQADFAQGFNIFQQVGPNYLGGLLDNHARTAIHLTHRIGALIVTVSSLFFIWRLCMIAYRPTRRLAYILLAVLIAQVSLGISNILFALPLWVAVAHNAFGAVLMLTLVTIIHRLYTTRLTDRHQGKAL